ncbi:MAG: DUF924 family protein [Pseudomonadota bacterium]
MRIRPDNAYAEDVLSFWFEETKPSQWYRRDARFDALCRRRFGPLLAAARDGALDVWRASPRPALARIIILDQFSRNIYRDDSRAFAQDPLALSAARDAVARRFDLLFPQRMQAFFLMPFMHAEDMAAQDLSVRYFMTRHPGAGNLSYAIDHRDIIDRFGRFPHRNRILGRRSTPEEIQFLKRGGFNP